MVARHGDFTRAIELTREMDKIAKTSPAGALLRARLYSMLGRTARRGAGLHRSARAQPPPARRPHPARAGQAPLGEPDEALRQAKLVLDVDKKRLDAVLLQAKALAESGSTDDRSREAAASCDRPAQSGGRGQPAIRGRLSHARGDPPQAKRQGGRRRRARKTISKANPKDAPAASLLIEILAEAADPASRIAPRRSPRQSASRPS